MHPSQGAAVAWHVAMRYPALVNRLIVMSGVALATPRWLQSPSCFHALKVPCTAWDMTMPSAPLPQSRTRPRSSAT